MFTKFSSEIGIHQQGVNEVKEIGNSVKSFKVIFLANVQKENISVVISPGFMIAALSPREPPEQHFQISPFHPEAADSSTGHNLQSKQVTVKAER